MINYSQINKEPSNHLEGSIIYDYAEFSGIPIEELKAKIDDYQQINVEDFCNKASVQDFYENSKTYIYDLLRANWNKIGIANKLNKFIPGLFDIIKEHHGNNFMEFGAGVGAFCEIIKEYTNKNVTYVDIKGHISDFALWRFNKYNLDIDTIIIPQDSFKFEKHFDIIFSDAVWEHLNPELQIKYLVDLDPYINVNGILVLLIDLSGENQNMPMHYNVDIEKICNTMKNSGYINIWGDNTFASVWHKIS